MYCMLKKKKYALLMFQNITQTVKSSFFLMIPNEEGWHCLAVKKISALLRGIMSTHHGDFYWPNCLHSFAIQNKRDSHEKAWESKDFCNVAMPSEDTC